MARKRRQFRKRKLSGEVTGRVVIGTDQVGSVTSEESLRRRPGRRSVEERTTAVLELLSGKSSVDQLARQFGVLPSTVISWRDIALESIAGALRQGTGRSSEELKLAHELESLRSAFTDLAIRHELVQRALSERPTPPARSPR